MGGYPAQLTVIPKDGLVDNRGGDVVMNRSFTGGEQLQDLLALRSRGQTKCEDRVN